MFAYPIAKCSYTILRLFLFWLRFEVVDLCLNPQPESFFTVEGFLTHSVLIVYPESSQQQAKESIGN